MTRHEAKLLWIITTALQRKDYSMAIDTAMELWRDTLLSCDLEDLANDNAEKERRP